jgi:hypothetical protein
MGVKRIAGTFGCTIEPPDATLYAVDPCPRTHPAEV